MDKYSKLRCPYCKKAFTKFLNKGFGGILSCSCGDFPVVDGIFYLKKDNLQKRAVELLKKGKFLKARLTLLSLRKRMTPPVILLLLFPKLTREIFGFENFIRVLRLFSYDNSWSWYLINRRRIPSYFLALSALSLIRKNDIVVDIGCGAGHFLPEIAKKTKASNVYGIDGSFFSLFLARNFFADEKSLLICSDIEKCVPQGDKNVDFILCTDTFHYLRNKEPFLKEIERVTSLKGTASILNNLSVERLRDIRGTAPWLLQRTLKSHKFNYSYYSDESLWHLINSKISVDLNITDKAEVLKNTDIYNFFVTRGMFKRKLSLGISDFELLKRTPIFYGWEPNLLNSLRLNLLIANNKKFIFLSPHLDDAILSSGSLIELMRQSKKNVKVVSIFTKTSEPPYSPQAKKFLHFCDYDDPVLLFKDREKEEKKILGLLGAESIRFDYVDAAWRKSKRKFIYKNDKEQFSGIVSPKDKELIYDISKSLEVLLKKENSKEIVIFAPLGIGGHVDHVIVKKIAQVLEKNVKQTVYWEDFPYNAQEGDLELSFLQNKGYTQCFELKPSANKPKYVKFYKSQFKSLFPSGVIPKKNERYYFRGNVKPE